MKEIAQYGVPHLVLDKIKEGWKYDTLGRHEKFFTKF
jgi:hypothetical protein